MQDAIILYENGKAIGGEGHPTYARDITFDNTGTDLVSEQTNDAIKEVNGKFDKGSVSVTSDGTKTIGQLLNQLASLVDFSKVTVNTVFENNGNFSQITYKTTTELWFTTSNALSGSPYVSIDTIGVSSSSFYIRYNGSTMQSFTNTVVGVGRSYIIYY